MVLGIAATAMPFAGSPTAEAERWLRILRAHGESGLILSSVGVSEAPLDEATAPSAPPDQGGSDAAARIPDEAVHQAVQRGSEAVSTSDVLAAVIHVYGETFDRVLEAHGTDRQEVLELLDLQSADGGPTD